ncbi:Abscisic acid 8'-hydroxylase 1 [Hibiscus syriacus]|uniref:Abscisic acid 8'-hydroxylase 1 n=1 Tax=Hibiscus syriacus TaxID=106335 RepID=A0A6A3AFZ4_HIBSY|nr:Abscisic acid 8'-hydroxylase 1 [Hibiscus syriacus]
MMSSPEAAKFVLLTKSHIFKPTFPASKERMLGKQAIFFSRGQYHAKLRKLYAFNVALLSIFEEDQVVYREDLKRCYYVLEKGYNSMAINLPDTLFNKSMKARNEIARILAEIISTRRQMKPDCNDLLQSFMSDKEGLTDEQIADNIIGVIFAARDTTASALTWIIKYLGENPSVLQAITEEQEAIMRGKEEQKLSWEATKKMPITSMVIQKTLRVASILSFTFREAVEDVEYEVT